MQAVIRRCTGSKSAGQTMLRAGPLELYPEGRIVTVHGAGVHLTEKEYALALELSGQAIMKERAD